ncbi:kinase-like domain, phloem protein 2-like protein, partial [Tanacetum coccineum]
YDKIYTQQNDMGLAPIARKCFNEGTIKDMLDPKLKEDIDDTIFTLAKGPNQDSLDAFSRIAYQCLAEDQIDRPRMEIIIKELEKALYFQENRKDNLKIPLEDIKSATQNFSCNNCIGIGGFGQVYKGVVTHDDGCKTLVAKRLDMRGDQGEQEFLTELEILFEYKHENIIHLVGYCDELGEKIIVYDYASNGSLDRHLKNVSLTWTKRLNICIDVANGLHFLHCGVVTEERVIHRDIKCANILLNGDWKAKISDFGLSILSPVNQEMEYAIEKLVGTIGYVDPIYESTGFLTKESDIYSFGVVLFEILFGRLLVPSIQNYEREPLTTSIKHAFEEGKLDLIVFEGIKEQIVPKSLSTFQMIVSRCLHDDREKRPTATEVLVQLMKALEFQEDYEIWKPKLPRDYKEILKMSNSTEIHTKTKKDLYNMLRKGILLQEGKVLFTLGDNGERNEMISARRFSYKNRWSHKWRSIPESRFPKVAEMLDISNLNIQIKIRTQFLSPEVNYRVHLIFKFCGPTKSATKPKYVNLKYKRGNENLNAYFATWREDGWMMIELCQLLIHKKHVDFEILLESFSRCYCGSRVVYLEGIEFQAIKDASLKLFLEFLYYIVLFVKREEIGNLTVVQDVVKSDSEMDRLPQLPSNNEEMFERSETNNVRSWLNKIKRPKDHMLNKVNTKKDHVLSKVHQKKERVLGKVHQKKDRFLSKVKRKKDSLLNRKKDDLFSSEEVIHDPSNGKLSDLEPSVQTRFQYVIETPSQQVYRIKCKIERQISLGNACYLVFKLSEKCRGLHCPVIVRNLLQGKNQETGILYFRAPSPWNLRDNDWVPIEREDGWMEVMVWKFNSKYEFKYDSLFVNLKLNYRSWRRVMEIGLSTKRKLGFVKGIVSRSNTDASLQDKINNGSGMIAEKLESNSEIVLLFEITAVSAEITAFLNAINTQKEEQRLFQFLNGLDDHFTAQRSQLLLTSPLPSVETACALLQQEESQREVFGSSQSLMESTALYSKTDSKEKCSICGYKWHPADKCWEKSGYPPWHYKYKQSQGKNKGKNIVKQGTDQPKRTAAVASAESSRHIVFTSKQFEQLMRSLPHFGNHTEASNSAETDDELDNEYVAGISWYTCLSSSKLIIHGWIIDTGASDHMTPNAIEVFKLQILNFNPVINLPNGQTTQITQIGKVKLDNGIMLKDVWWYQPLRLDNKEGSRTG